jgi:glycosyltransferase involved in cell wall biosynthesis
MGVDLKQPPSFAIVHHNTIGLKTDAVVLSDAIRAAIPDATLRVWNLHGTYNSDPSSPVPLDESIKQILPFDCIFFLEHVYRNYPFLETSFARSTAYIPNIEWVTHSDAEAIQSGNVNFLIFKNSFSHSLFTKELPFAKAVLDAQVLGWTSIDPGYSQTNEDDRIYNRFLHIRGFSTQKNTETLISLWLKNSDLPPLTVLASLKDRFEVEAPLIAADNLVIHLKTIPWRELRTMQHSHGVHVCPSMAEGFGHSLNEARGVGAILITTDGPPMSSFVRHAWSGVLIPVRSNNIRRFNMSRSYTVTSNDLEDAVRAVMAMPTTELKLMGSRARESFVEERQTFHSKIAQFLKLLL